MKAPGKKVGPLRVKLERKTSRYHQAQIEVELRLEVMSGTFHAAYEGAWYKAKTKDELADMIRKAAEKTIDVEWARYLIVDYEVKVWPLDGDSGRPCTHGSYDTMDVADDRAELARDPKATKHYEARHEDRVITSLDLHWHVCEYSTPYALPEDKTKTVRMRREVEVELVDRTKKGDPIYKEVVGSPSEQENDKLPPGAVLWTAEREALLREVLAALGKLDARLVALFGGAPDQLAKQLDAWTQRDPARLLEAHGNERVEIINAKADRIRRKVADDRKTGLI